MRRACLILLCCFLLLVGPIGHRGQALASIHTYPETETQTMYRSRLSVQDNQNQAWQLILFKRVVSGQVKDFNLRLISFPGQVTIQHPAQLLLEDSHEHQWIGEDLTRQDPQLEPVATSVGQYDLLSTMKTLDHAERMELEVTLENGDRRTLIVPQYMVKEWLQLKDTN